MRWSSSGAPLVPVVGADNAGFVGQLNSVEGLKGAAVTNPGSVGGAGVTLALQILNGKAPAEKSVLVEPALWENVTDAGKAQARRPLPIRRSAPSGRCRSRSRTGRPTPRSRSSPARAPASNLPV